MRRDNLTFEVARLNAVTVRVPDRERPVLDNVTLSVHPGDRIVLEGPSGGGKSTLLRVIAGLALPESGQGEVFRRGNRVSGLVKSNEGVQIVTQEPAHYPSMGALENIAAHAQLRKLPHATDLKAASELAERLGLEKLVAPEMQRRGSFLGRASLGLFGEESNPSGGEKMRLAVARAIFALPDLLILDEPTAALDPDLKTTIYRVLAKESEARRKMAMVVVSHDLSAIPPDFTTRQLHLENGVLTERSLGTFVEGGRPFAVADLQRNGLGRTA